jgi:hypothetical protein
MTEIENVDRQDGSQREAGQEPGDTEDGNAVSHSWLPAREGFTQKPAWI